MTRSLRIDDHQIDDWKPSPPPVRAATGFGAPPFGGGALQQHGGFGGPPAFPHHGFGAHAPPMPSIVYLVTSARPDIAAYLTDNPMGRPRPRATRSTSWCFSCRSGSYVPLLWFSCGELTAVFFCPFQSCGICRLHSVRCGRRRVVAPTTHTYILESPSPCWHGGDKSHPFIRRASSVYRLSTDTSILYTLELLRRLVGLGTRLYHKDSIYDMLLHISSIYNQQIP